MSDPIIALVMLGLFIVFIFLGFPIAFTLMAMGIMFGAYAYYVPGQSIFDNNIFYLFTQNTFSVMNNDVLISIPLFLFMGYIIERANILDRLFESLQVSLRHVPGSMAVAALITCALFATATGIVGAVVTLMGLLALPSMLKAGYDQKLATGVIAAGGTLGILIPPSIMLIVYAATAGVSVVKLYAAAMVPGILLATLYLGYVIIRVVLNPKLAPKPKNVEDVGFLQAVWMIVTAFLPLAALILTVLGSILFGLATPSEAAAMGALGGIVLAVVYRAFSWQRLKEAVFLTAKTTAMVCYLFVGSWTFSSVFSYLGGESVVKEFMLSMDLSTIQFLLLTQLIIFILGWPLEWSEIIIIFVPIFLPLLEHFGVDPLFFGILIAINLQTSFLTPPMAMSAYYLKGIAPKEVELWTIFKGCFPFLGMVFLTIALIYVEPRIVNWLPDLMYNSDHSMEDVAPGEGDEEGSVMDPAFLMGGSK
ncbi:MAG: TRAP transporter large permease subunit [Burkholderiaceae bacterium]|mgnify:FL=1|jgi:tripartite ATP-independent transporter DctM subunit|nr:TRAP transporter large permease subunit [Burkholderiaceae bacterium]MDO7605959.1 TRAP transporter large permease subunit [Burkholderiaceae bacterium]MDO7671171.1 TRAP transporter large permease subunit [Burkholderiaceae bacterium]MDO7679980.1 TRAP transporter large permease subunit [Burkholderiaceae bacterium]MDO7691903.1 TRAP transporter large permease subunit [Burkholderiaceae bacterium]